MPYIISSQSVTDGISLSVSKSKLMYSSLIFVDNKLTLICWLTSQQLATVSIRYTQVILLNWWVLQLWGQTSKAIGCMTQSTILPVLCQMFTDLKNSFHQQIEWNICNKLTHHNLKAWLVIVPCDLSLIIIHISDCRQFSDIHISQVV